jgi:hypothetical protein
MRGYFIVASRSDELLRLACLPFLARATAECARRWTAAGRKVTQLIPRIPGEDFADLVGEPS